ncbi:MAG TPA: hypothetical protein VN776_11395 [Terracidiphilus sp.]|nr:hypothetical protein [Terracidiphilus sp.]
MPWSLKDALDKTSKANTPSKQRQWAHVANSVLARTGNEGSAVRQANGVIKKRSRKKK